MNNISEDTASKNKTSKNDISRRKLSSEDKFVIIVVGFGFLGSIALCYLGLPSVLVAFFLATGIASLVYRFLGGIKSAKVDVGWLRLGGSVAALVGMGLLINAILVEQVKFHPNIETWFAIDKATGLPVAVSIEGRKDSIPTPSMDVFDPIQLDIQPGAKAFPVVSKRKSEFLLGSLSGQDLEETGLFNMLRATDKLRVTDRLPPNSRNVRLAPLPFRLSTGQYAGEYSEYRLTDIEGGVIHESSIYQRQAEVIRVGERHYLVGVVEVNHLSQTEDPYAKFEVRELAAAIQPQLSSQADPKP